MNKIAQKMLHHKKGIVALFAVLAVLCALLSRRVKVDYNMMHYLPKDAPSTIALDVMEEEYSAKTANCRIMIEDAAIPEALALKKQLQQVPGVSEVMWLDDYANVYAPLETLDGDTVESWYKEGNVLFTCYVDEDDLYSHLMDIRAVVGEDAAMSGEAVNTGMATESTTRELTEEARAKVTAEVTAAVQVQVEQQATRAARAQAEAEVRKQEQPIRDGVTAAIREQVKASITEEQIFSAAYENVCTQPGAENMTEEEKRGAAAALAASEREALLETVTDTAMVSPEVQQQIDTQVENEVQKQVDAVMAMPETQAAIQQQIDGQMVSDEVQGLIAMNIESAMAGDAVQSEIAAAVEQATGADSALIKPLNTLATQLTGFDAFYQGLLQYTNGVDSAARAASQVADGTARLQAGAAQVSGGAASLQQGSRSLTDGAARLAGGSSELAEGTGELRGRTSDMDSQLNDKIDELIDGFTGADYEICSFVSEKNTQVDAVQFVMTTPAIEEAEARRAPAQEAQTLSLWQRLLALFQ